MPPHSNEESDRNMINVLAEGCAEDVPVYITGDFNYAEINWNNKTLYRREKLNQLFLASFNETNIYQIIDLKHVTVL